MFIKTSNGKAIINTNTSFDIFTRGNFVYASNYNDDTSTILGEYYNEEDAQKVLNDILEAMEHNETIYIMPQNYEVEDIEVNDFTNDTKRLADLPFPTNFTYLFRAKYGDHWVYGSLNEPYSAIETDDDTMAVDLTTAGMYTGFDDSAGKKIFEGDIIRDNFNRKGVVVYSNNHAAFMIDIEEFDGNSLINFNLDSSYTIVGNIYD